MEQLDLAVPEQPPARTSYRVERLVLQVTPPKVEVALRGNDGRPLVHEYDGATAAAILRALNTADLSQVSLQRRVLQRLVADGVLAGAVSGTAD